MSAIKGLNPAELQANLEAVGKKPPHSVKAPAAKQPAARMTATERFILLSQGNWQMARNSNGEPYSSQSEADIALCSLLAKQCNGHPAKIAELFERTGLNRDKWARADYRERTITAALKNFQPKQKGYDGDGSDWREGCKSLSQLGTELPKFLVSQLIPEKALTFITAPSYHGKTWLGLTLAKAISEGKSPWREFTVPRAVPVVYHVPEMNEAMVRERMVKLEIKDSEDFLVRPMECGVGPLDDARMIAAAKDRANFLDTTGYFNPADDMNDQKQSLMFAELVYRILNAGGTAVSGLCWPPKYATKTKDEPEWTLENSVLGSAGYGGILRSCLRVRNLNPDLNDPNVWLYIQGLKNPGLKPFQLEALPLRMKVPPGESPYLKALLDSIEGVADPRKIKAFEMFADKVGRRDICKTLQVRTATVSEWYREWEEEQPQSDQQLGLPTGGSNEF